MPSASPRDPSTFRLLGALCLALAGAACGPADPGSAPPSDPDSAPVSDPDPAPVADPSADLQERVLTDPDPGLEDAIRAAAPDYAAGIVDVSLPWQHARYVYAHAELDGHATPETFVYLMGSLFCGTGGCDLMLFTRPAGGSYRHLQTFPITRPPVLVSPDRTHGWNDLVRLESGGGAPPTFLRHHYDGTRYVEGERTDAGPESTPPVGRGLLREDLVYDDGIPLAPGG